MELYLYVVLVHTWCRCMAMHVAWYTLGDVGAYFVVRCHSETLLLIVVFDDR